MGYTMGYICQNLWDLLDKKIGIYWIKLWDILWDIIVNICKCLDILRETSGI